MNRNKFCYSCANANDRCFRKEIGCPCEKYKSYKDEITERKAKIKLLTKKVGFWEEQTKLKKAQIKEMLSILPKEFKAKLKEQIRLNNR